MNEQTPPLTEGVSASNNMRNPYILHHVIPESILTGVNEQTSEEKQANSADSTDKHYIKSQTSPNNKNIVEYMDGLPRSLAQSYREGH